MQIDETTIKTGVAIIGGIYTVASIIIRLTPTEKDDKILKKIDSKFQKVLRIVELILLASKKKKDKTK